MRKVLARNYVESPLCRDCGKPSDRHCAFNPRLIPKGCACSTGEWDDALAVLPDICAAFRGDPASNCETCEHDMQCHAEPPR